LEVAGPFTSAIRWISVLPSSVAARLLKLLDAG
jgi:hypothetical protein